MGHRNYFYFCTILNLNASFDIHLVKTCEIVVGNTEAPVHFFFGNQRSRIEVRHTFRGNSEQTSII